MLAKDTPSPEHLHRILARAQRDGLDDTVIERLKIIVHFVEHQNSISETCRQFNISRSTFHRWMERFDPEDLSGLADKSCETINIRQTSVDPEVIECIRRYRMEYPQMGKERIAELLRRDYAYDVSVSTVGRVIERECLFFADTPLHWKKRMGNKASALADLTPSPSPCAERGETEIKDSTVAKVTPSPLIYPEPVEWAERKTGGEVKALINWQSIKRCIIVSSVITNIIVIATLGVMAFLEKGQELPTTNPYIEYQQQEVLHAAPPQVFYP